MAMELVTKSGLTYFWGLVKTKIDAKADASHTHTASEVTDFATEVAKVKVTAAGTADTALACDYGNLTNVPSVFTPDTHASNKVTALTDYAIASAVADIAASDSLNTALGKLEKGYKANILSDDQKAATNSGITATKVAAYDAYASGKADVATSLAGYGIEDAYTKTEIDNKLTSAMRFKGSVATQDALPASDAETPPEIGDMYNVVATGANYVWDGNAWDETGMVIDLSAYAKSADFTAVTNSDIDTMMA